MRVFLVSLLVVGFVASCGDAAGRQDQLFTTWQDAQRDAKSLVVQFTRETRDRVFEERQKAEGIFKLVRTAKGEVFASYEFTQRQTKGDRQERWSGLLNNGAVYLLDHDKKMAIRFEPTGGELRRFLEEHFNPFVLLLDQNRATAKCQVEVVKQDEWYTYLAVKPKQAKRSGWFPDTFHDGRVVLMNKASEKVPKDMPRQLWYTDGLREYTFEIQSWRLNVADSPKLDDFVKPEDLRAWEVKEWPFWRKK